MELLNLASNGDYALGKNNKYHYAIFILALGAGIAGLLGVILQLDINLPIGPHYWDSHAYFDTVNRINSGQIPSVDFQTPAGPLNYWLVTWLYNELPLAQSLLLVKWSMLLVTLPILAILSAEIALRSLPIALGIFVPFLLVAILPYSPLPHANLPSVDGYDIYNQQGSLLLYLAVVAIFLTRNRYVQFFAITTILIALAMTKAIALAAIVPALLIAVLAGYIPILFFILNAIFLIGALGFINLEANGALLAYGFGLIEAFPNDLHAIWTNLSLAVQSELFTLLAGLLIFVTLFVRIFLRDQVAKIAEELREAAFWRTFVHYFSQDFLIFALVLIGALFYGALNPNAQTIVILWPILLLILVKGHYRSPRLRTLVFVMALVAFIPSVTQITYRAASTALAGTEFEPLSSANLKNLGMVSAARQTLNRLPHIQDYYQTNKFRMRRLANADILPSEDIFAQPGFQLQWLQLVDQTIDAIKEYESDNEITFKTIMHLDYTNPYPFLMDRVSPMGVKIGGGASQIKTPASTLLRQEIAETDLILEPTCPILSTRQKLLEYYLPLFEKTHEKIKLSKCYNAYLKTTGD